MNCNLVSYFLTNLSIILNGYYYNLIQDTTYTDLTNELNSFEKSLFTIHIGQTANN